MDHQHHSPPPGSVWSYFSQIDFMPHGHCYLWKPGLVWTHVISDFLIGLAYLSISFILYGLVKKIKIQFSAIVLSFGVFIGACGMTHWMEIWNLWNADYWISAWVKVLTALASVSTCIYLYKLRFPIIQVAEVAKLSQRRQLDLEILTTELETRVDQRTKELKKSEARFKLLADIIPQLVWITDAKGNILYLNQYWYDFTGTNLQDNQNFAWLNLLHPDDRERTEKVWSKCLRTAQAYEIEYRMKNKEGLYFWLLARANPLKDAHGEIIEWFGTNTIIEDQKEIQAKLEELISSRDQFLSVASHELKTPLTSLILQTQFFERKLQKENHLITPESLKKYFSIAHRQTLRMSNLISDMLDVSRIKSQRLELSLEEVFFKSFIKEVLERLCLQFEEGKCNFSVNMSDKTTTRIDTFRIEQVINNILNNASKYAPNSNVSVTVEETATYLDIVIEDDGPGIEEKNLDRIFHLFERAADPNEQSGLGLGLYISLEIIEKHHGKIWAENKDPKGAKFVIQIPITHS